MGLINALIESIKKEAIYYPQPLDNVDFYYTLCSNNLNVINSRIDDLAKFRTKDDEQFRQEIIAKLFKSLKVYKNNYLAFSEEYKYLESIYNKYKYVYSPHKKLADKLYFKEIEAKAKQMQPMKKELHSKCEKIYSYFKAVVTNLKDKNIPMNRILKQMQISFDFDGSIFNQAQATERETIIPCGYGYGI